MHACFIPFYWSDSVLELASSGHFWSCNNNLPINKVLCISSSGVCLMLKEGCMGLLNFKDIKKNPGSQDYAVFLSSKKYLPGSWWALPLWTWTHSPWGKSKIGAPSTWRKSASSWRSWKRSDRPSSGSERRVRIEGALSATTRRKTDLGLVAFLGWVAKARRQRDHLRRAPLFCSDERSAFPTPNRWSWSLHQSWNYQLYTF